MEIFKPDYAMIDLMIFLPTLILSLFVKRNYFKLFQSIAIVSPLYLFWDFLATWKDSWSFNPKYVTDIYIINLPIEEVIFFLVTPFATLLIFDFVMSKVKDREINWIPKVVSIITFILPITLLFTYNYSYTFVDILYLIMSLSVSSLIARDLLASRNFWIFIGLSYIPFLVFDYFLTSDPIVIYGPHSILGIRITTIPIEDFIYSFSMLTLYTVFYTRGNKQWMKEK
ncbi:lycopene cyclase domain-containing protein [Acidianus sulfidivorans JP7]|uniref:Lycopene cyclase domain-containing protein n=1 Tax=Acidianus sulfidivorans JP7 TaxID=619593 RepID=A0A2U9IJJ7_9CREN|nr:lycopene cyclase domain-containing protein [Acidianus sulfidivorans]AWR96202.1 lycopene cyclase domain-containing protein [Acidianus sulfidivorans JP7]